MIQKDYIMRMIEQMGKILAKVLLNKEEGRQEEAIKEIDNSFGALFGIDLKLLITLPNKNIAELFGISNDKSTRSVKCLIAAKLFYNKLQLRNDISTEEYQEIIHKALGLYLRGMLNIGYTEINLTEYIEDIRSIVKNLNGNLSTEEMSLLFGFYKQLKEYNKAEDYLFHLKDANYPNIKQIGLAFLRELEKNDVNELAQAGLTSAEVKESIQVFEKIY
jgi:hypothetical protein